jgi:hypothetical protein
MVPTLVSTSVVVKVSLLCLTLAGAVAAWGGYRIGVSKCAAEREQRAKDIVRAVEHTMAKEEKIVQSGQRIVVQYRDRVIKVVERAEQAEQQIAAAEAQTPTLVDQRCAWPDSVREAVNAARAGGSGANTDKVNGVGEGK